MLQMLLKNLIVITLFQIASTFNTCVSQNSTIENKTIKWTHSGDFEYPIIISEPPCVDQDNKLITRICLNGSWYPKMAPNNCNGFSNYFELKLRKSSDSNSNTGNCFSKSLENYKCFYKSQNCKNFATIKTLEDKLILESLIQNDVCRLGDSDSKPNFLNHRQSYLSKSGWRYGNFNTNCSICEKALSASTKSNLVLSFEPKKSKNKLSLLVYSPAVIKFDDKFSIYCYTNAGGDLKKMISKKRVFNNLIEEEDLEKQLIVYELKLEKFMGEYWCEALTLKDEVMKSEKVIAFKKKKGNEYSLRLIVRNVCQTSCELRIFFTILINKKLKETFKSFNAEIRLMEIFNIDTYNDVVDVLVHISTGKRKNIETEYYLCLSKLKSQNFFEVVYFRSSEYCLSVKNDGFELSWPLTQVNDVVIPEEICLLKDGTPLVRKCEGDFLYGGVWSSISENCIDNPQVSKTTYKLKELQNVKTTPDEVIATIKNANLQVLDIYYLNKILVKFSSNESSFVLDLVDKIMISDLQVLEKSQELLNLTDATLERTDYVLSNLTLNESSFLIKKENLMLHVSNPFYSNISGLLLYGSKNSEFNNLSIIEFDREYSFDTIDHENLKFGVYVPELILEQIFNETEGNISDVYIVTTIFNNDRLFIDKDYHSDSLVISVSIPGFGSYLKTPIPIIFESRNNSRMCGFWDNGRIANWKKGKWSNLGSTYTHLQNDLHQCSFVHLTHFALLLMSDKKISDDETFYEEENILEIITIIGCSLSLFGITGIFATACYFQKWRSKIGTKILLHLSVAIFLEIVCIHLSEIKNIKKSEQACKTTGAILHYVVLSKFAWTLIYAYLQYYRFVKVIAAIPQNLVLKTVILGWGVPLVMVLAALLTNESYVSESYQLCYPRGYLMYITVLMPIGIIMLANLTIFCMIMYNVTYKMKSGGKMFKLKMYLALLLFSVLGIPWIFGLLAELLYYSILKKIFFTIFCITATLQGFVLFLFYVVLNKETRDLWLRFFNRKKFCSL